MINILQGKDVLVLPMLNLNVLVVLIGLTLETYTRTRRREGMMTDNKRKQCEECGIFYLKSKTSHPEVCGNCQYKRPVKGGD